MAFSDAEKMIIITDENRYSNQNLCLDLSVLPAQSISSTSTVMNQEEHCYESHRAIKVHKTIQDYHEQSRIKLETLYM